MYLNCILIEMQSIVGGYRSYRTDKITPKSITMMCLATCVLRLASCLRLSLVCLLKNNHLTSTITNLCNVNQMGLTRFWDSIFRNLHSAFCILHAFQFVVNEYLIMSTFEHLRSHYFFRPTGCNLSKEC